MNNEVKNINNLLKKSITLTEDLIKTLIILKDSYNINKVLIDYEIEQLEHISERSLIDLQRRK